MKKFTAIALTTSLLAAGIATAQASDTFVGLTYGQTDNNIRKSNSLNHNLDTPKPGKVINDSDTFGVRLGKINEQGRYYLTYENVSDKDQGYKLRQQNLLGSYDLFVPVGEFGTKAFAGASMGLVKLDQESPGFKRDNDIGYAVGVQLGVIQPITANGSVEGGYRYLRSNVSTEFAPHGGAKLGSLDLHSSGQLYLGANYQF